MIIQYYTQSNTHVPLQNLNIFRLVEFIFFGHFFYENSGFLEGEISLLLSPSCNIRWRCSSTVTSLRHHITTLRYHVITSSHHIITSSHHIITPTYFPMGRRFDPVYIMMKKNTPVRYSLGITGLS